MILFSDGAPLTPAGGSSWSLTNKSKALVMECRMVRTMFETTFLEESLQGKLFPFAVNALWSIQPYDMIKSNKVDTHVGTVHDFANLK